MKSEILELRQVGGSYDGAVKITRNVSDEMVFYVNSGSVKIKDGRLTTSGNIYCDGVGIGDSVMGAVIRFVNPNIVIEAPMRFNSNVYLGWDGNSYELTLLDPDGNLSIELAGTSGYGLFKGGILVGDVSGAAPGTGKFKSAGNTLLVDGNSISSDNQIYLKHGSVFVRPTVNRIDCMGAGLNVGASQRAVAEGEMYTEGQVQSPGQKHKARFLELEDSASPPAASASYRGFFAYQNGGPGVGDKIICCMKDTGDGYSWQTVFQAP